eukprot:UN02019
MEDIMKVHEKVDWKDEKNQPIVDKCTFHWHKVGSHMWRKQEGDNVHIETDIQKRVCIEEGSSIFFNGSLFGTKQGWVEGAVETTNVIFDELCKNLNISEALLKKRKYEQCWVELQARIKVEKDMPAILLKAGFHEAATYDKKTHTGGANGSLRFPMEHNQDVNANVKPGVAFLRYFQDKYPVVSWADIIQMAAACSVSIKGGPGIKLKLGRVDAEKADETPTQFPNENWGAKHLRNFFKKLGFNDEGTVALYPWFLQNGQSSITVIICWKTIWPMF